MVVQVADQVVLSMVRSSTSSGEGLGVVVSTLAMRIARLDNDVDVDGGG
jgi:hypothetical protein